MKKVALIAGLVVLVAAVLAKPVYLSWEQNVEERKELREELAGRDGDRRIGIQEAYRWLDYLKAHCIDMRPAACDGTEYKAH